MTLFDSMDRSLPGFSVHGDSPGKNIEVGCQALLQGIFPTQGWNPGLLRGRSMVLLSEPPGSLANLRVFMCTFPSFVKCELLKADARS